MQAAVAADAQGVRTCSSIGMRSRRRHLLPGKPTSRRDTSNNCMALTAGTSIFPDRMGGMLEFGQHEDSHGGGPGFRRDRSYTSSFGLNRRRHHYTAYSVWERCCIRNATFCCKNAPASSKRMTARKFRRLAPATDAESRSPLALPTPIPPTPDVPADAPLLLEDEEGCGMNDNWTI